MPNQTKQYYKAVYFSDFPAVKSNEKSVTLAFSEPELPYFKKVKNLSSQEIKELIEVDSYQQLSLFAEKEERSINQVVKRLIQQNLPKIDVLEGSSKKDVTFVNSKSIPFQRWYPYIEGYSPDFVHSLMETYAIKEGVVYDPFCGTGTTVFTADSHNLKTIFSEVNPLLQFLIQTKTKVLIEKPNKRKQIGEALRNACKNCFSNIHQFKKDTHLVASYQLFNSKKDYFPSEAFDTILRLRSYIDVLKTENELVSDLFMIGVLSSLLQVSYLKKAGDVRFKKPKEIERELKIIEEVLPQKIYEIAEDIENTTIMLNCIPEFILCNAKNISRINDININAIITSPPYLNGTNYFRNTKLELWFLRYINSKNDLRIFRDQALTNGINDVRKSDTKKEFDITSISPLFKETWMELKQHAYDSRIPLMATAYFEEMYVIFRDVRTSLKKNAKVLIDIGDSIFAGVHIKTDEILIEILSSLGYKLFDRKILRKRRSRNKQILIQTLIVVEFNDIIQTPIKEIESVFWSLKWDSFKKNLPHQTLPYSKRNWGNKNHSICSYQGKLKPAIAHHLVNTFVPENGRLLDPFSGVGTIPFEAALNGKQSYGIDLSTTAYFISSAKLIVPNAISCQNYIDELGDFIQKNKAQSSEIEEARVFGYNKKIIDYYEEKTLEEILLARRYYLNKNVCDPNEMLVLSCLLHILHGNRPYALSRRSHSIVPYAPKGEFEYKNLITKLKEKVNRTTGVQYPLNFKQGKVYNQDCTKIWHQEINNLDAVITSPPFFDSTRFHTANWIRLWFSGWSELDFKNKVKSFVEEKQKVNFDIYKPIFRQAKERLKPNGVCVLHLGKSKKCDMAQELIKISKRWFRVADLFDESVAHCESHGIRDKGTVTSHQYLVLY